MKFGTPEDLSVLDSLDLSLPEDHPKSISLPKADKLLDLRVGCSVWGQDDWVGKVFPDKTKKKDYLSEYINHFNSIELNSTFYNIKKANMQSWAEKAKGHDFKFCPKVSRRISHIKRLKDEIYELMDYFIEMSLEFEDNLGMAFLQMPENFGPKWFERLEGFVQHIPKEFPMAVELRHAEWYEGEVYDEVADLLSANAKSLVITDTAVKRDILHQRILSDSVFIRFAGYDDHATNQARIDEWVVRLKEWHSTGVKTVYFNTKQENEFYAPDTADYLIKRANQVLGLNLSSPLLGG